MTHLILATSIEPHTHRFIMMGYRVSSAAPALAHQIRARIAINGPSNLRNFTKKHCFGPKTVKKLFRDTPNLA